MSVARLIALSGRPRASYVGSAEHAETLTSLPLPAAAKSGDLAIVTYLAGRTISGGSGNAWTVRAATASMLGVAFKVLEPGDISNAINFNAATNVITEVVRGPRSISTQRTGVSFNGTALTMTGFAKSPTILGFYSAAFDQAGSPSVAIASGNPNPFDADTEVVGPASFGLQSRVGLTPSLYTDNTAFVCQGVSSANKGASVFEFLL